MGENRWDFEARKDLLEGLKEDNFFWDVVVFLVGGKGVDVGGTAWVEVTAHVHVSFSYYFGRTQSFYHCCAVVKKAIVVPRGKMGVDELLIQEK